MRRQFAAYVKMDFELSKNVDLVEECVRQLLNRIKKDALKQSLRVMGDPIINFGQDGEDFVHARYAIVAKYSLCYKIPRIVKRMLLYGKSFK